ETHLSQLGWFLKKYVSLAQFPGYRHYMWSPEWLSRDTVNQLREIDKVIWLVLHIIGLAVILLKKSTANICLLLMPLATLLVFNLIEYWPTGNFRTNVFVVVYMAAIAAIAVD